MSVVVATSFTVSLLTWALPIATFLVTLAFVVWTLIQRTGRSK